MHDADVAASMARAFLVAHAGDLSTQESAAIGRYLVSCEREVTRLRRLDRGAVARRRGHRLPARPRTGGRRPLAARSAATGLRPASRGRGPGAGRARPTPAWASARIAPSRMPASETRIESTP